MKTGTSFHRLPKFEAGCRMPDAHSIVQQDARHRTEAEIANDNFLAALARYFERGGKA